MNHILARKALLGGALCVTLAGCASSTSHAPQLPPASFVSTSTEPGEEYIIGALDELTVFVWRNPELGAKVQVRPDGRITLPLVNELVAIGRTPAQLSEDIKARLGRYIENPLVSVIVNRFNGTFSQQIRIVGATARPASVPYRANMTLLDVMILVGGLNENAAGNRARLIRTDPKSGKQSEYGLRIGDLLRNGNSSANVKLAPGDVIIIPESAF